MELNNFDRSDMGCVKK